MIGKNIKILRKNLKITQEELAKEINVTQGQISFWENDINEPTATNIISLCRFFDISADILLGLKEY